MLLELNRTYVVGPFEKEDASAKRAVELALRLSIRQGPSPPCLDALDGVALLESHVDEVGKGLLR